MSPPPLREPRRRAERRLPAAVYGAAQVREMDRITIEELGVPSYELMTRAGRAALGSARRRWPRARHLAVYCGAGNNAGDGYVLGRLAAKEGMAVRVVAVVPPEQLRGDAERAWRECRDAGVAIVPFEPDGVAPDADVVADALLGTGLDRPLEGPIAVAVERINGGGRPVLALDVPTGLNADTGAMLGSAVRATLTVTFVGLKQGLFLGMAPDYLGDLELADLGVPDEARERMEPVLWRLTEKVLEDALPRRRRSAHKGDNGRLLLVGGGPGMSGAIRLSAEAALRAGAGLVYVATHPDSVAAVMCGRPEIMCRPVRDPEELKPLLALADGVVLGPGLGRSEWARAVWQRVAGAGLPLVMDADGLNLLAEAPDRNDTVILTPHPGEASRLLGRSIADVQADRRQTVADLAERFGGPVVLKGACSLVASRDAAGGTRIEVCDRGNPGLGSGGTGDVLTGVVGSLLVQTRSPATAARAGVLLHALAADDAAAEAGERGMIATDLMSYIRRWANPL